jgi:Holliday junction DNA helicase RuvA
MINWLQGTIKKIDEKVVTLLVAGIGFKLLVPHARGLSENKESGFFIYFHWNAEHGPSLYGFQEEIERDVFLLIIDCPKIGPGIALNILAQISPSQFLDIVASQNESALSAINGIGPKKAEQIIVQLKHKVSKFIDAHKGDMVQQQSFVLWQNVSEVLSSLNYSKQEIGGAMQYLVQKYPDQNSSLDQLLRTALAYLSTKQI